MRVVDNKAEKCAVICKPPRSTTLTSNLFSLCFSFSLCVAYSPLSRASNSHSTIDQLASGKKNENSHPCILHGYLPPDSFRVPPCETWTIHDGSTQTMSSINRAPAFGYTPHSVPRKINRMKKCIKGGAQGPASLGSTILQLGPRNSICMLLLNSCGQACSPTEDTQKQHTRARASTRPPERPETPERCTQANATKGSKTKTTKPSQTCRKRPSPTVERIKLAAPAPKIQPTTHITHQKPTAIVTR